MTIQEKAIEQLERISSHLSAIGEKEDYTDIAIQALEQKSKQGHWILLDECSNSGYYCSECQKKVVKEGWSNTVKKIKYCPNCGSYNGGGTWQEKEK